MLPRTNPDALPRNSVKIKKEAPLLPWGEIGSKRRGRRNVTAKELDQSGLVKSKCRSRRQTQHEHRICLWHLMRYRLYEVYHYPGIGIVGPMSGNGDTGTGYSRRNRCAARDQTSPQHAEDSTGVRRRFANDEISGEAHNSEE
jgi:hypothetical protein